MFGQMERNLAPFLSILLSSLAVQDGAPARPEAKATKSGAGIKLDGIPNEPAWAAAPWRTNFSLAGGGGKQGGITEQAAVQTRFKALFDDNAVYVAVQCDEPRIEKLKARTPWRDGAVWQDDCIEIFFDPSNQGRYYHQVMVNARGTIYDSYSADFGLVHSRLWNGAFRAAGHVDRDAKKWSVEVEIPFGAIVLDERAGNVWRWNVARERHAGGKLSLTTWSPLKRNFHQPNLFGSLTGLPDDYSPFQFQLGEPRVDVSRASSGMVSLSMGLTAKNETGTDRRIIASAALFKNRDTLVQCAAENLAGGKVTAFDLPPLRFRGSAPKTHVVFAVREAGTGRLLKAVVKHLSTEYRPITIRLLQPCYRNNIYASEELKEIVFRVSLAADVQQAAESLSYALRNQKGDVLTKGSISVRKIEESIRLAAGNIPVGNYTLKASAKKPGGGNAAENEIIIRKLPVPRSGNEVRIDENRNLLVNGKPLFAIGWYGSVPLEDPRAEVVALQNIQTPVVIYPPDASPIRNAFEKNGIYSVVTVENGRLQYSFKLWQKKNEHLRKVSSEQHKLTEPSDDLKRLAKELVDSAKGEPGLLGYYIADEPEIHDIPSAYLENYYQYLRELDPYHPVFITNDTLDGIVTHGYKCADVLDPDPYSSNWDYVPNFMKRVNEVAGPGKATYVTLWHASRQAHFTLDYGSGPAYPYRVFRNQYFAALAYGAKGFTAYTSAFFMVEPEYRYGLPYVWRELRFLEKAILSPRPETEPSIEGADDIAVRARAAGGHVYLILVHHKPGAREVTVRWEPLMAMKRLYVMSEGRDVDVKRGTFADHFKEGDVHIYTDDPKARDLPTIKTIADELARRKEALAEPGNLLHWTRGTKVRASKGFYAPWFHQFYYYAVNGITDDKGWNAYAWDKKSAWVEMTLKSSAQIGRLVIHTPNLRDYQLDFLAADGTKRRAKVNGNNKKVVIHRFRPPVDCLKLRLTATAVRDGAPQASEIEAYTEPGEGPATPIELVMSSSKTGSKVLFAETGKPNVLWADDFAKFETAPKYYWKGKDTKWVLNERSFRARPRAGGGITTSSISAKGYAGMTHIFPYDPAYRFFQVKLSGIRGKGYRFTYVGFGSSSGSKEYRRCINTARPGIYTVDTHGLHPNYRTGKDKTCFITISCAGSSKQPDDTIAPGPEITFDWLRLVRDPQNGLAVTRADGTPLGEALQQGDALRFELHLLRPATDAIVEVFVDSNYRPLSINGQPYVQLRRSGKTGKVWIGEVTLGPGAGSFTPKGYPVFFKACITGGDIAESWAPSFAQLR